MQQTIKLFDLELDKHFLLKGQIKKIIPFKKYKYESLISCVKDPLDLILGFDMTKDYEIIMVTPYLPKIYQKAKSYANVSLFHFIDDIIVSKKARYLIISNPHPLTGITYNKEEMDKIINLALRFNLFLVVYEQDYGLTKRFLSFSKYNNYRHRLFVINMLETKNNQLSLIVGPKDFIRRYCNNRLIYNPSKTLVRFFSSRHLIRKLKNLRNRNYEVLEEYCIKNKIIYNKNCKSNYFVINKKIDFFVSRGIYVSEGSSYGYSNDYCVIPLIVKKRKINKIIKRLAKI